MFRWESEGRYRCTKSMVIAPFWFSMEPCWTALMPFWLSADDMHPRCINLRFERKSEKSIANWFSNQSESRIKDLRLSFLICVQTQILCNGAMASYFGSLTKQEVIQLLGISYLIYHCINYQFFHVIFSVPDVFHQGCA